MEKKSQIVCRSGRENIKIMWTVSERVKESEEIILFLPYEHHPKRNVNTDDDGHIVNH